MNFGPFTFHISERTSRRLVKLLPADPNFRDIQNAMATLDAEDIEAIKPKTLDDLETEALRAARVYIAARDTK